MRVVKTTYLPRISEDQPMYVRLLVENTGDMDAIIDSVILNLPNSDIVYKPKTQDQQHQDREPVAKRVPADAIED